MVIVFIAYIIIIIILITILNCSTDFWVFSHCLGLRESEIEGIWNEVYGNFDKAMLKLVVRVLQHERGAEEVLASALTKIEDKKSALIAAKRIERGKV